MKFQVFQDGKPADEFVLSAEYMFGADTVPLHAVDRIEFSKGTIECQRKSNDSAGLALLWPVGGFGRVLLPTTRLPERPQPYILNVELARARLMQITLKREDWSLFEGDRGLAGAGEEARHLFIEALQHIGEPARAAKLADESLRKAMVFSEKMALKNAEKLFASRCKSKGLGRHSLGCRVNPELMENEQYAKWMFDMFGFVTIPVNWGRIERERGKFDFTALDRCMDHLSKRRVAICAGPVLRFSPEHLPEWLLKSNWEFEKVREAAYGFVSRIVTRYSKFVHAWRVIGGMNGENCFGFNFEQVIEMTRTACLASRAADVKSRKMVEILYPWGEYYADDRSTVPPLVYADMVIQSGIAFDAFSLEIMLGKDRRGMHVRDLMQISSRLDCFSQIAKPLHISGVAVPDSAGNGPMGGERAGQWHKPWDQDVQAEWIDHFYRIALGKGFIHSITYAELADAPGQEVPGSGLLSDQMGPKKALLSMARLQKRILNK